MYRLLAIFIFDAQLILNIRKILKELILIRLSLIIEWHLVEHYKLLFADPFVVALTHGPNETRD